MRHPRLPTRLCVLLCSAVGLACSSSAKKGGEKPTILLTEYDDARVGEEASEAVAAEIGLLGDPALDAYVGGIGRKLLRGVPRRSFGYRFQVVDQFEPNAFALPGGFIYISRGLLALAEDEDELANVIGHEIVHAASRHAAVQQALAGRGNPLAMPWIRAANMASYARDMERDADRGGQMLAAAAGYDPMAMSTFLGRMDQMERLRIGHPRQTTFFDTHPGSRERAAANAVRSHEIRWRRDPALGDTRATYLRHIDGLAVGPRPEGGVFDGDRFLHPDLGFQIRFPDGWRTQNTNQAVGALAPRRDAMIYLMADQPPGDPREVAEAFVEKTNEESPVEVKESGPVKVGRIDAWRMRLRASSRGGSLTVLMTFVPYADATWRITAVAPALAAKKYQGRMLSTTRSFRPLSPADRRGIHGKRLHLVTARAGETLEAISARSDNAWDTATTALYNGVFTSHRFEGGERVKVVRVEPYVPAAR